MATVRSLNVSLSMNLASFGASVKRAGGMLASLTSSVTKAAKAMNSIKDSVFSVQNALAGMAVVSVGKSLINWVGDATDRIDAMLDKADQLGDSVRNISELGYAADMTGSSAETFTTALSKMQAVMGKGDEDSDAAAKKFAELGLSITQLQAMAPTEAFFKIGDAIKQLPGPAQQASAAIAIFGKKGQELLPMLRAGAEGAAELRKEAAAIGIGINDIDAFKIASAKDALDAVWKVIEGMGNTLAIQVAPYVTAIGDSIKDWAVAGNGVSFITTLFEGLETVILSIIEAIDKMINAMGGAKATALKTNNFLLGDDGAFFGWQIADPVTAEDIAAAEKEAKEGKKTDTSNITASFANIKKRAQAAAEKQAAEAEKLRFMQQSKPGQAVSKGVAGATNLIGQGMDVFNQGAGQALDGLAQGEAFINKIVDDRKKVSEAFAKSITEAIKTPSEKLKEDLDAGSEAVRMGFLSAKELEAYRQKKLEEAEANEKSIAESLKSSLPKLILPSAIRRGTAEALTAENNFKAGNKGLEPIKSLDKTAKEQLREARKQTEVLRNFKAEEIVK